MSETRNILDTLGNIIGQLTLDDGTSESIWTEKLAQYSTVVSTSPTSTTVSAIGSVTTTSSTASVIGSMTLTPPSGRYLAMFNGSISTGGASASGEFGIYKDGVLIDETKRPISCNLSLLGGLVTISLNTIGVGTYSGTEIILNGSQTIDVRFKSTNGGTIGFNERVFSIIKV